MFVHENVPKSPTGRVLFPIFGLFLGPKTSSSLSLAPPKPQKKRKKGVKISFCLIQLLAHTYHDTNLEARGFTKTCHYIAHGYINSLCYTYRDPLNIWKPQKCDIFFLCIWGYKNPWRVKILRLVIWIWMVNLCVD